MKIVFCSLSYVDDRLLVDLHRSFHFIESVYLKKENKSNNIYVNYIYPFRDRVKWFNNYHQILVDELHYRFRPSDPLINHNTPAKITPNISGCVIWKPPFELIDDSINYLKHRYQFKNKDIRYTKRNIPDFLVNIQRTTDVLCDTCIYYPEDYQGKRHCITPKLRQENSHCENWENSTLKFKYQSTTLFRND